jgi:hypothetical protein
MIERMHILIENAFPDADRVRAVKDLVTKLEIGMYGKVKSSLIVAMVDNLHVELADIAQEVIDAPDEVRRLLRDGGHSTHRDMTRDSAEVQTNKPTGSTPAGAERSKAVDMNQMIKDLRAVQTSPRAAVEPGGRAPDTSTVTPGSGGDPGGDKARGGVPAAAASAPVNAAEAGSPQDKAKPATETDKATGRSTNRSYFSLPSMSGFNRTPKPAQPANPPNTKPGAAGGGP